MKILTRRLEIVVKGISEHFQEAGYTVGLLVCRRESEKHRALLMSKPNQTLISETIASKAPAFEWIVCRSVYVPELC